MLTPNEDTQNTEATNRYLDEKYAEREEGECIECGSWFFNVELTWCSAGDCEQAICETCRTPLQMELAVCSTACAEIEVARLKVEVSALRDQLCRMAA